MLTFEGTKDSEFESEITKYHREFLAAFSNILFKPFLVEFSTKLQTTAGSANYKENKIKLNYRLFKANPGQLRETYGHELAHLLSVFGYGSVGAGHGWRWKATMRRLGLPAERCHDLDVSAIRTRPRLRYRYMCINVSLSCTRGTKEFYLTRQKHNNPHRYRCHCGAKLMNLSSEPVDLNRLDKPSKVG